MLIQSESLLQTLTKHTWICCVSEAGGRRRRRRKKHPCGVFSRCHCLLGLRPAPAQKNIPPVRLCRRRHALYRKNHHASSPQADSSRKKEKQEVIQQSFDQKSKHEPFSTRIHASKITKRPFLGLFGLSAHRYDGRIPPTQTLKQRGKTPKNMRFLYLI